MTSKKRSVRFGVLGCSEFAGRAMIPAIRSVPQAKLVSVASRNEAKACLFARKFGCSAVSGYARLLDRDDIDAVYISLPPWLHAEWVSRSLAAGKHVLCEKPFTTDVRTAKSLVNQARRRRLLVMENFLFIQHGQFASVRSYLHADCIGRWWLARSSFTIPPLKRGNHRYRKEGGALLDLGCYQVRFARAFLGEEIALLSACVRCDNRRKAILGGAATYANKDGQVAQLVYGFDTHYQCFWEFLGAKGKLIAERGFTPPPGFSPSLRFEFQGRREDIRLPADNHALNQCRLFTKTILDELPMDVYWRELILQAVRLAELCQKSVRI